MSAKARPAKVWWVIGDAGAIYFSLGEPNREERQLDAAAVIFGLSAAQKAVAGHMIAGRSLEEAAEIMKIKESSTRTHLDRVFEKPAFATRLR